MASGSDEPTKRRGEAPAAEVTETEGGPAVPSDPILLDPTEAELEEWAERERQRRQAWLNGPTAEERSAYARRERERRLSLLSDEDREALAADRARAMLRYPREMQLAMEGALNLMIRWSRRHMADLVHAGQEWEEQLSQPGRRSRVPLDEDDKT